MSNRLNFLDDNEDDDDLAPQTDALLGEEDEEEEVGVGGIDIGNLDDHRNGNRDNEGES